MRSGMNYNFIPPADLRYFPVDNVDTSILNVLSGNGLNRSTQEVHPLPSFNETELPDLWEHRSMSI